MFKLITHLTLAALVLICLSAGLVAADGATEVSTAAKAAVTEAGATSAAATPSTSSTVEKAGDVISAEVDWFKELIRGGNTSIALIVLFLAMIGFAVERAVRLRRSAIIPNDLVPAVRNLWHQGQFDEIQAHCAKRPSILAKMVKYVVEHREADPELLIPGVGDIAVRELKAHNQRAYSLAVVAGLAPLVGLLGTMIGMIESFKLVEQYGDEGGASMLAGSISKALITTAIGLIIAIPSLALYHFFKFRCNDLGHELDEEMEVLINAWLLKKSNDVQQHAGASVQAQSDSAESDEAVDAAAVVAG